MVACIEMRDVAVGYQQAVQFGLNDALPAGKMVALIGPNGVGKTTLLRTLCGFLPLVSGDLVVGERHIREYKQQEISKLMAVVLTEKVTHPFLSVKELVAFGRYPHQRGGVSKEDQLLVEQSLSLCGVSHLANMPIQEISDGERQKVMIARALAQDTPIILLDEPTAHLDIKARAEIFMLLQGLCRKQGKTVIIATHEISLAVNTADKLWLFLEKGVHQFGLPEEILCSGILEQYFSGEAVSFNSRVGDVVLNGERNGEVCVRGTNEEHVFWTKRALKRLGFEISEVAPEKVIVGDSWQWDNVEYPDLASWLEQFERKNSKE